MNKRVDEEVLELCIGVVIMLLCIFAFCSLLINKSNKEVENACIEYEIQQVPEEMTHCYRTFFLKIPQCETHVEMVEKKVCIKTQRDLELERIINGD